ncbi:MAG: TonB-dependent receptor [Gammaproteobacteria bacterium]|nr:TonB-dependent receptor [Gammaproteobacteria bacterium]
MVASAPALGQELEEVLVTATKRSESAQDVPLAITALSGDFTRDVNMDDVKDLVSFTPGVTGNSQDSFIDAISVRGIRTQDFGVGGDPSAAFFKNDLYEGRNGSAVTSLYDMERAEILRGPQGFLFGRNSIGGAFSVHTRPAEVGGGTNGYLELDAAERGHIVGEGAVGFDVNDSFAMRIAGYSSTEDGFARNFFNGGDLIEHDKWAIRWSTSYENDALSLKTTAEFETRDQSGSVYRAIDRGDIWDTFTAAVGPVMLRGSDEDIDSDQSGGDNDDADILTLGVRFDYDFDQLTLTSNTGFKDHDYFYNEDYDGTPLTISNYRQDQDGDYFQQELRLTSNSDGPFSWYAGVSYYKETIDAKFLFSGEEDIFCQYYGYYYNYGMTFSGCADLYAYYGSPFTPHPDGLLNEPGQIIGDYSGWGAYVDLSYAATDSLDFSVGVRYSDDEKDFSINVPEPDSDLGAYWAYTFATDGPISETRSWDDTQVRASARYRPNDTAMLFGSYTEGFKSGGFGSFALVDSTGAGVGGGFTGARQADGFRPNAFNPETVDSWEFGYKDTVADGNANISLTAFFYDYQDLQVVVFDGGAAAVENVGQVDGKGFEGTITARMGDNYDIYAAASWLDTEATQLQSICGLDDADGCEGSSLFWAPEFTGAVVLNGHWPASAGEWSASLEVFWESERGGGFENLATTKIDSYTDATLRFGYESENNWSVNAYVENLTDEFTWDGLNNNGGVLPSHFFGPKRPRTFGITYTYHWD